MELTFRGARPPDGLYLEAVERRPGDFEWAVANEGREPVAVDRLRMSWQVRSSGPLRLLRHGYQSWSATGGGTVGTDQDQSVTTGAPSLLRGTYHADAAVAEWDELRSELVTVLADDLGAVCLGFDGGARHDGTFRLRDGELVAEAYFGGALLRPGERRQLHPVRVEAGDPPVLLDRWARWAAARSGARAAAPYRVGWCSWYQYFAGIDEELLRGNLARAADWPIDVFQLDDGYQAAVGDWLQVNEKFPSSLEQLACDIAVAGLVPGIWTAPFLAVPGSHLASRQPDWLARRPSGKPVIGMVHGDADGGPWGGPAWALDTTHPEVQAHLEHLARALAGMGWRYLKLDFTYVPSLDGRWHDPTKTPAERVRAGYDALRRGAGDDVFLLGCGAPLGPCIGVVDGMRTGPDVAPVWAVPDDAQRLWGYGDCQPATVNAWRNTLARSFLHRRLWLNDPDCLMLRRERTALTTDQVRAWAFAVAASGGMALISDDLARLDGRARRLLDEAVSLGRQVDARAAAIAAPSCPDLLDRWTPTTLDAGVRRLVGDPLTGRAALS